SDLGSVLRRGCSAVSTENLLLACAGGLGVAPAEGASGDLDVPDFNRILHWEARATRDAAGRTTGLTITLHDVTQEREIAQMKRDEKGHRLALEASSDVLEVFADPQLLRQVVLNLASNAIKYSPSGGDIGVRLTRERDVVRWQIQDTGIGIPKESQRHLFEKFYRADNVAALETDGTGLGLYLVRLIVEQIGGHVGCDSEEGRGATF